MPAVAVGESEELTAWIVDLHEAIGRLTVVIDGRSSWIRRANQVAGCASYVYVSTEVSGYVFDVRSPSGLYA